MNKQMTEPELIASFDDAIKFGYIFPNYQPKINHTTGRMIGAESLMRWKDPVFGMQCPSDFIPVLENNDLIHKADLHLFRTVCKFLRRCIDDGIKPVPISVNMSRYDIYNKDYVDNIESVRKEYDIPVKYLHIEITESSTIGGMDLVSKALNKLHEYGYTVEMDDFGSGYSSLNVLKNLNVDVIKLDIRFFSDGIGGRGGAIINAVVQMAKWLDTPIIAEGVETMEQADYLKSIGCKYIQGYLYSKPVPENEFLEKINTLEHEPMKPALALMSAMDAGKLWDPTSMETLIFNNFVGGAVIFTYQKGKIEILRVNKKYVREIGMNMAEQEIIKNDPLLSLNERNRKIFIDTLERAIASNDEQTCDTWRTVCSKTCGEDKICVRSYVRVIGKTDQQYLFYAMVHNVTSEKNHFNELYESERRFRFASEHANVYAWEVDLKTKEMHPCFRCMRDLNVPPVVYNYPEPLIETGIFPSDYADMYRQWMKSLENGETDVLERVMPLSVARIPFYVRYTLERDENGKPLKAYGSATLVLDNDKKEEKQ